MNPSTWVLLIVLLVVVIAAGLSQVAHRLDRLNLRVATAAETLRAARAGRSAAALAVATSGTLDPATSVLLADAALRAADAQDDPRAVGPAESDLTAAIRASRESRRPSLEPDRDRASGGGDEPDDPRDVPVEAAADGAEADEVAAVGVDMDAQKADSADPPAEVLFELDRAGARLSMARRLYNDAAAQCTQLHRARMVRWFHLAGHSSAPPTLDFDDDVPAVEPAGH